MHIESLIVVGAGGHAKVVIDALERGGKTTQYQIQIRDGDPAKSGLEFMAYRVQIPEFPHPLPAGLLRFHLALGRVSHRVKLFEQALQLGLAPLSVVHPLASVSPYAKVGEGSFVAAQAVLAPNASTGLSAIINHGAVVDHDVRIGSFTHIAPNVTLGGEVEIGDCSLIGAGAVVLPGCKIGANSIVGAGSVVTKSLPPNSRVIGIPAKAFKD